MNTKKLLLLGGSAQQIVAINTAKKLGYYTVLCDYLTDNPGQYHDGLRGRGQQLCRQCSLPSERL